MSGICPLDLVRSAIGVIAVYAILGEFNSLGIRSEPRFNGIAGWHEAGDSLAQVGSLLKVRMNSVSTTDRNSLLVARSPSVGVMAISIIDLRFCREFISKLSLAQFTARLNDGDDRTATETIVAERGFETREVGLRVGSRSVHLFGSGNFIARLAADLKQFLLVAG